MQACGGSAVWGGGKAGSKAVLLRHVDHKELVSQTGAVEALTAGKGTDIVAVLDSAEVGNVFGIEMVAEPGPSVVPKRLAKKGVKVPPKAKIKVI